MPGSDAHERSPSRDITSSAGLTRRRALVLGVVAGLGSVLRLPAPLSWAAARRSGSPRSFGLDVPGEAFRGGRVTGVLRAPRRFDLLGVRGAGVSGAGLQVRVRRAGGSWSRWVPLGTGHGPNRSAGPSGAVAPSDPVWAGGAHELQLRSRRPLGGLRVHFVALPAPSLRARAAQEPAPAPPEPEEPGSPPAQSSPPPPTEPAPGSLEPTAASAEPAPGTAPAIIRREAWGGDGVKPRSKPEYGEVKLAFVHHTVSANDYQPQDSAGIVLSIAKYHRDTNGWNDLGYNFLVDKFGQVFEGRAGGIDMPVVGAHAQGYNDVSTGVASIGTFTDAPPTDAAIRSLAHVLAWKLSLHGVPVLGEIVVTSDGGDVNRFPAGTQVRFQRICGHRDGDKTSCPGNALFGMLPELRRRAAALAGPVSPRASLSLDARASAVSYGDPVQAEGILRGPNGVPAAGVSVSVQKLGKTSWVTLARATTGPDGAWRAAVPWRRPGRIRAKAILPDAGQAISRVVAVELVPILSARAYTTRVRAGSAPLVTGTLRPGGRLQVRVERQVAGGRWARVADVPVRATKRSFATRIRLRRPGLYRLTPSAAGPNGPVRVPGLYVRAVRSRRRRRSGGVGASAAR
jgi:N-acetylmuramoyl-L-alanine amidase-like protein